MICWLALLFADLDFLFAKVFELIWITLLGFRINGFLFLCFFHHRAKQSMSTEAANLYTKAFQLHYSSNADSNSIDGAARLYLEIVKRFPQSAEAQNVNLGDRFWGSLSSMAVIVTFHSFFIAFIGQCSITNLTWRTASLFVHSGR